MDGVWVLSEPLEGQGWSWYEESSVKCAGKQDMIDSLSPLGDLNPHTIWGLF